MDSFFELSRSRICMSAGRQQLSVGIAGSILAVCQSCTKVGTIEATELWSAAETINASSEPGKRAGKDSASALLLERPLSGGFYNRSSFMYFEPPVLLITGDKYVQLGNIFCCD